MATTLSIKQYTDADTALRAPIEPPQTQATGIAMGAYTQLAAGTRYVVVRAIGGTCTVRVTRLGTGDDASSADYALAQDAEIVFPVVRNTGASGVYVTAT